MACQWPWWWRRWRLQGGAEGGPGALPIGRQLQENLQFGRTLVEVRQPGFGRPFGSVRMQQQFQSAWLGAFSFSRRWRQGPFPCQQLHYAAPRFRLRNRWVHICKSGCQGGRYGVCRCMASHHPRLRIWRLKSSAGDSVALFYGEFSLRNARRRLSAQLQGADPLLRRGGRGTDGGRPQEAFQRPAIFFSKVLTAASWRLRTVTSVASAVSAELCAALTLR